MFELSVALKYLIPRKKQLSVSLIALLSVAVISLVVWLVLVFLSVTEGIERNWLKKLTTLNAPLRITPTPYYFSSYYYRIDEVSSSSHYALKNIAEKAASGKTDPYSPEEDGELPMQFPQPDFKDPVKQLYAILKQKQVVFQDFELSGALMRLQLVRPAAGPPASIGADENQGYLTQVSYLASYPDQCPDLASLILPPSEKDLNHLFFLASHTTELSRQDSPTLTAKASSQAASGRIQDLLRNVKIKKLSPQYAYWQLPFALLPDRQTFSGEAQYRNGKIYRVDLPLDGSSGDVKVWREGMQLFLQDKEGSRHQLSFHTPLLVSNKIDLNVEETTDQLLFKVRSGLQGIPLNGQIDMSGLKISQAEIAQSSWLTQKTQLPVNEEKETGVLLAKSFLENGVMIGDRGYLAYSSTTSSSLQEHRLPIFVAGFYDPGIISVGNKCILVPPPVTRTINASSTSFNLDKTQSNGVLVWFDDLSKAEEMKQEIAAALAEQGIDRYWKVTAFREYEFAKDLLQQFQSDKYLFALIGVIILVVACCNIISLLVLLVNDKKREIGILCAMGASRLSIAAIFGACGIAMGIISCIIGTLAAVFTMRNIDSLVHLLSFMQGHDAFNAAFFGKSLPDQLSSNAVTFVMITTPFISLLAGLVPAIKACALRPSAILRSE